MKEKKDTEMNERITIRHAQEGDREAFRKLFEENKNLIFSLAYRYTKNMEDAEDILQDTFIKAYHSLHTFHLQNNSTFSSWIYRICINCSIDFLRKNKKRKQSSDQNIEIQEVPSSHFSTDPESPRKLTDVQEKLNQVLEKLSTRQRMIFILKHYQEMGTKEIAEYMNCSEGSVKKQLFRAVSIVKENFRQFFPEKNYELQKI
jgi:RNA polymerase sigma-70 factor (ECF subfamily)